MQDEDARDEEEERCAADTELGPCLTEEDGDGEHAVGLIALDILEIFHGQDAGIGEQEEAEKQLRESLELLGGDEEKSGEENEDACTGGQEGGDDREALEPEGRNGIDPGNGLIAGEEKQNLEGDDTGENERGEKKRETDDPICFRVDGAGREWAAWIGEDIDILIMEIIDDD